MRGNWELSLNTAEWFRSLRAGCWWRETGRRERVSLTVKDSRKWCALSGMCAIRVSVGMCVGDVYVIRCDMHMMRMSDLCVNGYVSMVCGHVCGVCVAFGTYVVCSLYVLLCGCVCGRQVGGILPVSDEPCLFQALQQK